jgi:glycosyltransferase involved in cell wall biosynthesis
VVQIQNAIQGFDKMKIADVSVVLNMHREALFIRPTLKSLEACAYEAGKTGINVELIAVFDRADTDTISVFHQTPLTAFQRIKTTEIDVGSLGLARNAGIELSEGEYIWTADGDDLVSRNAIVQLVNTVRSLNNPKVALFLEFLAAFGDQYHVARYMGAEWLTAADFAFHHPFVSRLFIHRNAFEHNRYHDLKLSKGFAYEDWDFNCRLLADGYQFNIAPDTVLFYRQRSNSLLQKANMTSARLIPHNQLFDPELFKSLMQQARHHNRDWRAFMIRRQSLHERSFSKELSQSESMKGHISDATQLDPEVEPDRIVLASSYCPVPWDPNHWGFQLEVLYKMVGVSGFTDVLLLPWLKPGGAEKYILQILAELKLQGVADKILVMSGQSANKHEWVSRLPKGSVFIDLYNSFPSLDDCGRNSLAVRAVLAMVKSGGRLHLKASEFAHQIMESYGAALSSKLQTIYYRFSDDSLKWEGQRIRGAWGVKHLRDQLPHLNLLVSDCQHIVQEDKRTLGVSAVKHHVIYAKCDVISGLERQRAKPRQRFLWSSRISSEKRPELLILLGTILRKRFPGLVIDVFGHFDSPYTSSMFKCDSFRYRGTYSSFVEVSANQYDAFIYTTAFDGLPNVILEALGAGLPVIAPNVGGISEAVIHGETGFLLEDHVDDDVLVSRYELAVEELYANWADRHNMSANAQELIANRHSQLAHSAKVAKIFKRKTI